MNLMGPLILTMVLMSHEEDRNFISNKAGLMSNWTACRDLVKACGFSLGENQSCDAIRLQKGHQISYIAPLFK